MATPPRNLDQLSLGEARNAMGKKRSSKNNSGKKGSRSELNRRRPSSRQDAVVEILRGKNINAHLVIHRKFLSLDEINTLKRVGPMGRKTEHDRDDDLEFEHEVWRFEKELEKHSKPLLDKVLKAMFEADSQVWQKLPAIGTPSRKKLHPEIEFIQYDADKCRKRGGSPPQIEPHVDNSSAVTLIGMLSQYADVDGDNKLEQGELNCISKDTGYSEFVDINEGKKPLSDKNRKKRNTNNCVDNRIYYEGGYNRFEIGDIGSNDSSQSGGIAKGQYRELRLNMGDILLFRGEICEHSLTPVTNGLRQILQIELCRAKAGMH